MLTPRLFVFLIFAVYTKETCLDTMNVREIKHDYHNLEIKYDYNCAKQVEPILTI